MEALLDEVLQARHSAIAQLGQLLDEQHDAPAASAVVRSLMFINKFAQDVQNSLDRL
jgi:molecular chaperone HscB